MIYFFHDFHFIYSLAVIHATGLAYQTALGGKLSFLTRFPLIKEENMPKGIYIRIAQIMQIKRYCFA